AAPTGPSPSRFTAKLAKLLRCPRRGQGRLAQHIERDPGVLRHPAQVVNHEVLERNALNCPAAGTLVFDVTWHRDSFESSPRLGLPNSLLNCPNLAGESLKGYELLDVVGGEPVA